MGVYRQQGSKNWYIRFMLNGKTYVASAKTANKKTAQRMETEWKAKIHSQQYLGEKERITIGDALDLYLSTQVNKETRKTTYHQIKVIKELTDCKRDLADLTSRDIQKMVTIRRKTGIKDTSIRKMIQVIRTTINTAARHDYATPEVEFPKVSKPVPRTRYLSDQEERQLLDVLDPDNKRDSKHISQGFTTQAQIDRAYQDNYDFVIMLLDTGARYKEMAELPWQNVDLKRQTVLLWRPKTSDHTVIPMTDRVKKVLQRRYRNRVHDKWVFTDKDATGPRKYHAEWLKRALDKAGLEGISCHIFRHTFATRMIQNGMTLYDVSYLLGHTDPTTVTVQYAHLSHQDIGSRAVNILNSLQEDIDTSSEPNLKVVK